MPLYYQLYQNNLDHHARLDIPSAASKINIPWLIAHGTADETVSVQKAYDLHRFCPSAQLLLIENGQHTFGGFHPFNSFILPEHTQVLVENTVKFLNNLENP